MVPTTIDWSFFLQLPMRTDDGSGRPGIVRPRGSSTSPGRTKVSLSGRQLWQVPLNRPLLVVDERLLAFARSRRRDGMRRLSAR